MTQTLTVTGHRSEVGLIDDRGVGSIKEHEASSIKYETSDGP